MGKNKTIRVLGRDVPVIYYKRSNYQGQFDREAIEIRINSCYSKQQQQETLLHEIMHCLIWLMGFRWKDAVEEEFVSIIAPTLFQVLRDNKGII